MDRSDFFIQNRGESALAHPGAIQLPLVSFVLTGEPDDDFAQVIEAVRKQSYPRFEAILVDASATASSHAALERQIAGDHRFQIVSVDTDPGPFGRAFLGLAAAEGEFITFLDATELPLPNFAAIHIQTHLASRHSVAFTASPFFTARPERDGPSSPLSEPSAAWPQPGTPVLRLACIDDSAFADLASRVALIEPTRQGWTTSSDAAKMYRRFILDLLDPQAVAATEQPSSASTHYAPLCQMLGGSASIAIPLSSPRPTALPEPTASREAGSRTAIDERNTLRVWAANGSDFVRRIGSQRYWNGLALLLVGPQPGQSEMPGPAQIAARADGLLPLLSSAFGERQAIHQLDERLPRPAVLAVLKEQYGGRLPLHVQIALRTTVLRRMREAVRQYLRARKARGRKRRAMRG